MKKLFALALVLVMVLSLAACDLGISKDDLCHKWVMKDYYTEDEAKENLEAFGFYEDEIALADLNGIAAVRYLTFDKEGNYSYYYDEAETAELLKNYYDKYITTLYNHKEELVESYGEDVIAELVDEETFKDFYAYMFSCEDYTELLQALADDTFDLSDTTETGTYKISGDKVVMYETGDKDGASVGIKIENGTITVTYVDGTEVYTQAD